MKTGNMRTVSGTFESREAAESAVAVLGQRSVPDDAIEITLIDETGLHPRGHARRRMEWWHGMKVGLAAGAAIGGALFALVAARSLPTPTWMTDVLPTNVFLATLAGMIAGAGFAGPATALLSIGHESTRVNVSEGESAHGMVAVSVHGDDVATTAREVFRDTGAEHVSG